MMVQGGVKDYRLILPAPFPRIRCFLGVRIEGGRLTGLDYLFSDAEPFVEHSSMAREVAHQLVAYLAGERRSFDLPLDLRGTPFQRRVWSMLGEIPYGERRTYGALARELGSSPRAVGNACRANPLPIVVPCHRVVSVSGFGGYAGHTSGRNMTIKRWLLTHEQREE